MKTIITSTATALALIVGMSGNADAKGPLIDNSTKAKATSEARATGVGVGIGVGKGGEGGGGGNATIDGRKLHNNAPGLALGAGGLAGSSSSGYRNGCGLIRSQNSAGGIGAGVDNGIVSGGILAYNRGTTQGLLMVGCEIGEQSGDLYNVGLVEASQKVLCIQEFSRKALAVTDPGFCDDMPVATVAFAWSDDEEDVSLAAISDYDDNVVAATPAVAAVAPDPAPRPVGNATGGRCTNGFDYTTGQCAIAKKQAFVSDLRHDG